MSEYTEIELISSDGTNESAYVTQSRRQAKAWNAVDNFCKPFNLKDPDQQYTGIAFLIVCDMLLTGFDAPTMKTQPFTKASPRR
jgi:type I restriction enzyme R subunit